MQGVSCLAETLLASRGGALLHGVKWKLAPFYDSPSEYVSSHLSTVLDPRREPCRVSGMLFNDALDKVQLKCHNSDYH